LLRHIALIEELVTLSIFKRGDRVTGVIVEYFNVTREGFSIIRVSVQRGIYVYSDLDAVCRVSNLDTIGGRLPDISKQ
jgi:hypothetical protein